MLSFLGKDYEYEWPEPVPLDRRLKDVLENEVDEKYYIKNEKADRLILDLAERGVIRGGRECIDLTVNSPQKREVANCVVARTDCGISNLRGQQEQALSRVGVLLSQRATHFERKTDIATCLMARDYKGFGKQATNGVIEIEQD